MDGHIFNIQNDGTLVEMNEQRFENEDKFQSLLEQYPNLLAGDQINSSTPRRWLLICREMGIPAEEAGSDRWSLDHLFLDQDAIPTLVEVKRCTDTRIRREVVGQMFDYAANAVTYWSIDQIIAQYEKQCESDNIDPETRLKEFLNHDYNPEDFWQAVKTNLKAGKVRLLFVADAIPTELRRIVEFLNAQMDPAEVLAIEIKHFVGQGLKTLVPRVIGQTSDAETRKGSTIRKRPLTEVELQQIANANGVGEVYSTLVKRLKPLFENMTTTRSNVAFNGKVKTAKTVGVILTLSPGSSSPEHGVNYGIYSDRLAWYFDLEKQAIINVIPEYDEIKDFGEWGGDHYTGFVKTSSDFDPLISLMKQSMQNA